MVAEVDSASRSWRGWARARPPDATRHFQHFDEDSGSVGPRSRGNGEGPEPVAALPVDSCGDLEAESNREA
jgi:hypothetical protein